MNGTKKAFKKDIDRFLLKDFVVLLMIYFDN